MRRHRAERAGFGNVAQARTAGLLAPLLIALAIGGCARAPRASSGTGVRDRFLAEYAAARGPTRGVASISLRRSEGGRGGARTRWAANGESLAVVGYVGPSHVMDSALKGDSLYLVIRQYGLGISGRLAGEEEMGARLLRFIATPWDFSEGWVREALERAEIRESGKGWLLLGDLAWNRTRDVVRFALEISPKGEPLRLGLREEGSKYERISIQYGPPRNYHAARIPSWIEWKLSASLLRLEIEDYAPVDPGKIRYAPPAQSHWTVYSLESPEGRALVRWLLGLSEETGGL